MTEGVTPPRIHVPIPLRWGDLDALNHVNNTSMLKLLEEARLRAFWRNDEADDSPPTAVLDTQLNVGSDVVTLIARQEIEYLAPVPYGMRPLDVQLWIGRLGGSSIDVCFEVYSPAGDEHQTLYARATVVIVLVDSRTGRPTRLTDEMRTAWAPFESAPIVYGHRR